MLFKISGSDCYLVGTIHVLPTGSILPAALNELALTHELVIEHIEEKLTVPLERSDGRVLSDDLDEDVYRKLHNVWEQLNINDIRLSSQAPWRISLIVTTKLLGPLGLDPSYGVEKQPQNIVTSIGKKPKVLETLDSVIAAL